MTPIGILFILYLTLFFPASAPADEAGLSASAMYRQGIETYHQSDFLSAISILKSALPGMREQAEILEARKYLARSYIAVMQEDKGREEFVQILKLKPDFALDPWDSPKIVEVFEQARKLVPKEIKATVAVPLSPEPPAPSSASPPPITLPPALIQEQNPANVAMDTAALPQLAPIPALPPPPKSHLEKAKELYAAQKYDQTIEELQLALLEPAAPGETRTFLGQVYYQRGMEFYQEQKLDEAVNFLSRAVLENPSLIEPYLILGKTYLGRRGMAQKAIEELEKAVRLAPDHVEALTCLAQAYISKPEPDYHRALNTLNKALKLQSDNWQAYNLMALIHYSLGELEKSVQEYHRALKLNQEDADLYYGLGNTYQKMGRFSDAIIEYLIALKINPGQVNYRKTLAVAYEAAMMKNAAIREWKTVFSIAAADSDRELANQYLKQLDAQ